MKQPIRITTARRKRHLNQHPPPPVQTAEVPDWVATTPEDIYYDLTMIEVYGGADQHISLTRAEYIALKAHLATMRGYTNAASK